ncbi:MAG TPA: hypothetical protein VES42_21135 [Pilimelia sp.]|nr:hypothetical protein [Pilimelia sp.]
MTPPPPPQFPPPGQPPPGQPPIRAGRIFGGIGIMLAAHAVVTTLVVLGVAGVAGDQASIGLSAVGLVLEVVLLVAAIVVGLRLMNRGDRGLGLGLIIGWPVGLLVLPVIGFGVCVAVLASSEGFG